MGKSQEVEGWKEGKLQKIQYRKYLWTMPNDAGKQCAWGC